MTEVLLLILFYTYFQEIQEKDAKMESILKEQITLLEKISGFTKEKARDMVMRKVEDEMSGEIAVRMFLPSRPIILPFISSFGNDIIKHN